MKPPNTYSAGKVNDLKPLISPRKPSNKQYDNPGCRSMLGRGEITLPSMTMYVDRTTGFSLEIRFCYKLMPEIQSFRKRKKDS